MSAFIACGHVCMYICACVHACEHTTRARLQFRGKLHIRVPLLDLVTLESKASASLPATAMLPWLRAIDILPIAGTIKHRLVTLVVFQLRTGVKEFREEKFLHILREN